MSTAPESSTATISPGFFPIGVPVLSKTTWSGCFTPICFPLSSNKGSDLGGSKLACLRVLNASISNF